MRKLTTLLAAALLVFGATACGNDDDDAAPSTDTPAADATQLAVTAKDYAFDLPATFKGGRIDMTYTNAGKEPHFAAFVKVADGKSFADVKAALTAPPSATPPAGPPPFEEWAGSPTADPGASGQLSFNLPAGAYAIFCAIPAPDGQTHAAKGMVQEVTVTEGDDGELPEAVGTIVGVDFALTGLPELEAGKSVVQLRNDGKQAHEINLIELGAGKKLGDVVAWAKAPAGPPPHKSLSGVFVKPGEEGTTEVDLKAGSTYAFICVIPDVLGDFAPHLTKGMATAAFTV